MLGIGSGSFDPETLVILETAFDEAWITLKTSQTYLKFAGHSSGASLLVG